MKRLISMAFGLALAISLWSGPAWAGSELMEGTAVVPSETSYDGRHNPGDPITSVFSNVQSTLDRVGFSTPLRSLINTVAAELMALELQLAELYDDLFVETCPTCDSE